MSARRTAVACAAALGLLLGVSSTAAAAPPTLPDAAGTALSMEDVDAGAPTETERPQIQRPPIQSPPIQSPPIQSPPIQRPNRSQPTRPSAVAPTPPASISAGAVSLGAPAGPVEPTRAPRTTHAPAAPRHHAAPEVGLTASETKADDRDARPHKGAVADFRLGTIGCVRTICNDNHGAKPGVRLDGFIGGNIRGFVELGLAGGWGTMSPDVDSGANVLSLYGLDPLALQTSLLGAAGAAIPIDFGSWAVTGSAKMRTMQVGPVARVHFVPRGRIAAFAGAGVQYNLVRSRYETAAGEIRMDLHGLAVPIQAGLGVHVHKHFAVMAQFDYLWTWYGLAVADHPDQRLALPVSALEAAAQDQGSDFRSELPQFWNVGIGLRARM